ncbi:unnamed protein product [Rhizoctonia solani]|uniref:Secreted protein n=1 Tax=Rhizoctonia solani TaxID=456999 RepID=A0A8H3ANT6_9AGAM|nr:unnamed protein product [Rhizoctonia solani]
MLFNCLFSLVALTSFAVHALTTPMEIKSALDSEGLRRECDKTSTELKDLLESKKIGLPVGDEGEAKIANFKTLCVPQEQTKSNSSMAAVFLEAQRELDTLKPQIMLVMRGPLNLGSIEKKIGELVPKVQTAVRSLKVAIGSFNGVEPRVVYGNPTGGPQLTHKELAKVINTFLSDISEVRDTVKKVSGYTITSALYDIRTDISDMKNALKNISPELAERIRT